MQYLALLLMLSVVVNLGGGWLLKRAWQDSVAVAEQLDRKQAELEREVAQRDAAIEEWREAYVQRSIEWTAMQRRLADNQQAKLALESELGRSLRRIHELSQADPAYLECARQRVPDGIARELWPDAGTADDHGP